MNYELHVTIIIFFQITIMPTNVTMRPNFSSIITIILWSLLFDTFITYEILLTVITFLLLCTEKSNLLLLMFHYLNRSLMCNQICVYCVVFCLIFQAIYFSNNYR